MADKIRVGIWGLGRAGNKMHAKELENYKDIYEITAGYDAAEDRQEAFKESFGCKVYDNEEDFLNDENIDLISIATRSTDHIAHAKKALATGKYLFLEKPIALSYDDALQVKKLAEEYPGKLYLRHNRRFEAPYNHVCEIIESGVLGDIYEVKLRRHSYQRRADWQTIIDCGGGQLNNWGPHIIDHALCFLESPVKEIWSDLKLISAVGDAEDHLKIILKGENDRVVDLEISGGVAIPEDEYIVFGKKGALTCDGKKIKLKYIDPEQVFAEISAEPGNPPLEGGFSNAEEIKWVEKELEVAPANGCDTHVIWKNMYEAIKEDKPFRITIDEAIEVVWVTEQVKKGTSFAMK